MTLNDLRWHVKFAACNPLFWYAVLLIGLAAYFLRAQ